MAVIGGDVLIDPKGLDSDSTSPTQPHLTLNEADAGNRVLTALAHQEKLIMHLSDQVSKLARMRMPQPVQPVQHEKPKEIFGRLTAEVFVVIVAVSLTFILRIGLQRSFPEFYRDSAVSTVCDLIVAILVIRFAFICWEPLRGLASWTYNSIRNFFVSRGATNDAEDLSISGRY